MSGSRLCFDASFNSPEHQFLHQQKQGTSVSILDAVKTKYCNVAIEISAGA